MIRYFSKAEMANKYTEKIFNILSSQGLIGFNIP